VEQVDLLERTIELDEDQTKTEDDRKVKMTGDVYKLIVECIRGKKPTDFVFTREGGERIVDPRQEWYDLCVSAKLGVDVSAKRRSGEDYDRYIGLNLHDFRRSSIRNRIRRGVSQTVAMKISGHKTVSVFTRYNITDEKDLTQASALIEAGRDLTPSTGTDIKSDVRPLAQAAKPS
jgi:Phage integrase family